MKKKYLLLIAALLVLAGAFYAYSEFNRGVKKMSDEQADEAISASVLLENYESDEEGANAKFLDKIIEVEGTVSKIEKLEEQTNVYLETSNPISSVICEMEAGQDVKNIKTGDKITIKGFCTGYLMDVVMVRCIKKD